MKNKRHNETEDKRKVAKKRIYE